MYSKITACSCQNHVLLAFWGPLLGHIRQKASLSIKYITNPPCSKHYVGHEWPTVHTPSRALRVTGRRNYCAFLQLHTPKINLYPSNIREVAEQIDQWFQGSGILLSHILRERVKAVLHAIQACHAIDEYNW